MHRFIAHPKWKTLTKRQLQVLNIVFACAADSTLKGHPGARFIMQRTGETRGDRVSAALAALEELGFVRRISKGKGRKAAVYQLIVPEAENAGAEKTPCALQRVRLRVARGPSRALPRATRNIPSQLPMNNTDGGCPPSAVPGKDESGLVDKLLAAQPDITSRRLVEKALEQHGAKHLKRVIRIAEQLKRETGVRGTGVGIVLACLKSPEKAKAKRARQRGRGADADRLDNWSYSDSQVVEQPDGDDEWEKEQEERQRRRAERRERSKARKHRREHTELEEARRREAEERRDRPDPLSSGLLRDRFERLAS